MKIDFANVLFHKKPSEPPAALLGQVLGDISCEQLVMAVLQMKETTPSTVYSIAELPSSEDEEE